VESFLSIFSDRAALVSGAYMLISEAAGRAVAHRGVFRIVLAGGRTPQDTYASLVGLSTDWSAWQVYFGDERAVPRDHEERNSHMACRLWLGRVPIPAGNIHPIPAEMGLLEAVRAYQKELRHIEQFDLVLLGLGEDGHTAGLFPGHDWGEGEGAPDVLPVFDAPKPPPERITLSARRLSLSDEVLFLVSGAEKKEAVRSLLRGDPIPASAIKPLRALHVFVDEAAMP
jgi:6-phosphogluconolactonase